MEKIEYEKLFELEKNYWWNSSLKDIILKEQKKYFSKKKNLLFLDAGCGTGILSKELSETAKVVGADLSREALFYCRKRGLKNLINGTINSLPFKNNYFDAVFSIDVLYHKWIKNDEAALKEFNRVLKKNGLLIINVPAFDFLYSSHDKAIHTRHRYTKKELEEKIMKEGFTIKKIIYWNSLLFPFISLYRLSRKFSGKKESDMKKMPEALNRFLKNMLSFEFKLSKKTDFPFGLSVFCTAKKI